MQHFLWKPERAVTGGNRGWWNCGQHAVMAGALMQINGHDVEILKGEAFFAQGPKPNGTKSCLHRVPVHCWIRANDIGLVDFSPDLGVEAPGWDACEFDYVFGNKAFARMAWSVDHTDRMKTVNAKLKAVDRNAGRNACIYLRKHCETFDHNRFFGRSLISNQNKEPWAQAALLYHLQKLLENERESLGDLSMMEAWNALRSIPRPEIDAVTARLIR
jgi:hypothetical protein